MTVGSYFNFGTFIFLLILNSFTFGDFSNHHYIDAPVNPSMGHKHHQVTNNKRHHDEMDNPSHFDGPHNFIRKTNKKRKTLDNPKIMLVIWGMNGEIIEDPHIMLRHMEKNEGIVSNAEHLPKTELTPLIDCSEDLPANGIQTEHCHYDLHLGNGVTNITFRNPEIRGKVEISYVSLYLNHMIYIQAINEESHRISYIEDIDTLKVAADYNHSGHKEFHHKQDFGSETVEHRNILHLFYHNFKPFTYIYHIHGIIFLHNSDRTKLNTIPLVAKESCAHVEYDVDHDHNFGNIPYEFYHDSVTGNFRITIKNGYGLDPLRKNEPNYGKIRIAVAYNEESFRIKERRVYTIKISDYLRDSHDNFEKAVNHHTEKKPSRVLYLWADKEKMKYGPFPLRQREYSLQFKMINTDNAFDKPFSTAPMNWQKWLKIRDEDDEEILNIESTHIEHQPDGALIANVKLSKTIAEGFHLHIDCGASKVEYVLESFNHIIDKSDWIALHKTIETSPEVLVRVKYVDLSEEPQRSQFELRYKYSGRGEHPLMEEKFEENNKKLLNNSINYPHGVEHALSLMKENHDNNSQYSSSSRPNTYQTSHGFPSQHVTELPANSRQMHSSKTPPAHYEPNDGYYTPPYSSTPYSHAPHSPPSYSQQRQGYDSSTEDEEGYQDLNDPYHMGSNDPHARSSPYGRSPGHFVTQ